MLLGSCREMKASDKKCTTNLVPLYDAKQADVISKIEGIGYISNTSIVDAIDADYSDEYHSDESMDGIDINGDDCDDSDDDIIEIKDEADASAEFEEDDPDYYEDYETKIDVDPDFPSVLQEGEAVQSKVKTLKESEKDDSQVEIDREKLELPDLGGAKSEVNGLPLLEDVASNESYQNGMPVLEDVEPNDCTRRSARVTQQTSYTSMDEDEESDTEMPPAKRPHTKRSSLPKPNALQLTYPSIVRTSDADFPYKCHVCSKGFKLKQILVSHLKIHKIQNHPLLQMQAVLTGEAPTKPIKAKSTTTELIPVIQVTTPKSGSLRDRFRCNYCDKRFIEKITLLVHLNEHVEYKTDVRTGKAGYTELGEEENGSAKENGSSKGPDQPPEKCLSKKPARSKEESPTTAKSKTKKRKRCEEEKEQTFRCDECPRWYRNKPDLEKHRSTHLTEEKHQCDVCFRTFKTENFLNDHRKLHGGQKLDCEYCGESFNEAALKEHRELYCRVKQCECQLCGRRFLRSDELEAHLGEHAEKTERAVCLTCRKDFGSKEEMELHRKTCGEYECHLCKARKISPKALDRHMKLVHTRRAAEEEIKVTTVFYRQCSVCDVKFTLKDLFAQHMRWHFSQVKINFTGKFVTMRQLDFTELGNEYKCYICLKPATSFSAMVDHVDEHRSQMPTECCKIKFSNFEQFVKHKRAHMVILNCTKCECSFYTTPGLNDHQSVHNNATSKCPDCTKGYRCNICKCMFDGFDAWEKHVEQHRNDGPVLKLPELTASDVNNLKSALEYIRNAQTTVEKEYELQCKFCERGFRSLVELYNHRSAHENSGNRKDGAGKRKKRTRRGRKKGGIRHRKPNSVRDPLKEESLKADGTKEDCVKEDATSSIVQQT